MNINEIHNKDCLVGLKEIPDNFVSDIKILVACEVSGIVREAFRSRGFDAWSCDLLDTEIPGQHYKCDVLDILDNGWDMMIAHPPCTRLCNSGVVWLHKRNLWDEMKAGAEFFKKLLNANIPLIAVENPIPHKYALQIIGRKYDQIIQPFMFGHPESKATCFWLKNLPILHETNNVYDLMMRLPKKQRMRIHYISPCSDRGKKRSITFSGIAEAMAYQWGNYIIKQIYEYSKDSSRYFAS